MKFECLVAKVALLATVVAPFVFAQETAPPELAVVIESKATTDGTVEAIVRFGATSAVGAIQMELVFDPTRVQFEEAQAGADLKSALLESRLKETGRLAVALVSNVGVVGEGELLRIKLSNIDRLGSESSFSIENVRGWTLDTGVEVSVTTEVKSKKDSNADVPIKPVLTPLPSSVQIEYRLPPWAYAVAGAGATAILFLLVMLVMAERRPR
ncbi:MAG: hypothetical protein ACK5OC_25805 [Pirellula sp.]|jgi:hypothetical protein